MIRHDLSHWPLVLSAARGTMSLDEQLAFFSDWNAWLDRGESFSTLRIFTDTEALKRPEGGAKDARVWLQANGERLRQFVIGMATVVPSEALEEMSRMNAEKLFGVPRRCSTMSMRPRCGLLPFRQRKEDRWRSEGRSELWQLCAGYHERAYVDVA